MIEIFILQCVLLCFSGFAILASSSWQDAQRGYCQNSPFVKNDGSFSKAFIINLKELTKRFILKA